MSAPSATRERIIEKARTLLSKKGFSGFSYRHISEPLGIRNAAVHYHFPSKTDLGLALIERYREILRHGTEEFMRDGGDARTQIEGYFYFVRSEYLENDRICPIGILAGDLYNVPEDMRDACRVLVEEVIAWLARVLEVGREQGVFDFQGAAEEKAIALKASMQGAGQLCRVAGPNMVDAAIRQARRDLGMDTQP